MTDSQFSLQPNWQTAATIISMVLENPDARMDGYSAYSSGRQN